MSRRTLITSAAAVIGSATLANSVGAFGGLSAWAASDGVLTSRSFKAVIDSTTGGVYNLSNPSDALGTNFVINPTLQSQFNVDDSRWFGDLIFNVRPADATSGTTMVTGLSDDIRTVSQSGDTVTVAYSGTPQSAAGIRGFSVAETYSLDASGDVLTWTIGVTNTSAQALEFQDFGFPLLMNSYWSGTQTGIYEQNVSRHSFVAEDGSYIYWQRPNGVGPFLVMVPGDGARLEYKNKARAGEGPFAEVDPAWEGLVEYYVHSKNVSAQRVNQAGSYLPATSLTLDVGASKSYSFTFRWAANYGGLRDAIFAAGGLDVISMPGMVVPQDSTATLAVRAAGGIVSVVGESGKAVAVATAGASGGYSLYKLSFPTLGTNKVTVTFAGARTSVLQYYSIRPVEELISTHAAFLAAHQQAKTTRGYNGAFLQWSMYSQSLITWDDYPGGGWQQWMAGGSDDLGLSPAEFLSEKNTTSPVQAEVSALDYYITNFLLGYLQAATSNGEPTYQVYRWYDGQDTTPYDQGVWRAYNYIHIANTYFNMYRISTGYPSITTTRGSAEYLELCFQTLNAMFNKIPQPTPIGDAAHDLGLMGESTYPDILAALVAGGKAAEAEQLQQLIQQKRDHFFSESYPFASEQSIDTTGFESTYTLAKMFGNSTLVSKVQNASMACRGLQPLWFYYGSDNRSMGESWWNLSYETQIGAWQQQDYLLNFSSPSATDFSEMMRSTGGAYLAGWANINSGQISAAAANIGAAAWLYQSELGDPEYGWIPLINGWWSWSGEADLGFWGGLRTASVNVVDDPVVGLYAYNADIALTNHEYEISPKDGVRTTFTFHNLGGLTVKLARIKYSTATVADDRATIALTLEPVSDATSSVTLQNLPAGAYTARNGTFSTSFTSTGSPVTLDLPAHSTGVLTISLDSAAGAATLAATGVPVETLPAAVALIAIGGAALVGSRVAKRENRRSGSELDGRNSS